MISKIIAKANGKDKVIDFRDNLSLANQEDYASIHGTGGAKHARVSAIKTVICDYTNGTGEKSVTVSANLGLDVMATLFAAAEKFVVGGITPPAAGNKVSADTIAKANEALQKMVAASKSERELKGDDFVFVGAALRAVCNELKTTAPSGGTKDFEYSQEHVNIYGKGKNGLAADFAPVDKVLIWHQSTRPDGSPSRYPWTIKISNGSAQVKEAATGSTSYVGSTYKTSGEAFIVLSNMDMFRMMNACNRFVRVWENTYGIPLLAGATEALQEEFKARQQY